MVVLLVHSGGHAPPIRASTPTLFFLDIDPPTHRLFQSTASSNDGHTSLNDDLYGFQKVDPDRWEFANAGFLGGQRHLLKTIRRKRNVAQSVQPKQEYSPCIEVGQYGIEEELEGLKRERSVLMAEIVRLRQLQQHSKDHLIAIENRLKATERKQQNMMGFLAKAFSNPEFLRKYMDKNANKEQKHIQIGRKRRLTMTPRVENLPENIDLFITALFEEESSSNVRLVEDESHDNLWEELLNVDLPTEEPPDDFLDDLDGQQLDWDEDLQELVDQMEYLRSSNA